MSKEYANDSRTTHAKRRQTATPEHIPAFRAHLEREGLTLAEWQKRNAAGVGNSDLDTDALILRKRRAKLAKR